MTFSLLMQISKTLKKKSPSGSPEILRTAGVDDCSVPRINALQSNGVSDISSIVGLIKFGVLSTTTIGFVLMRRNSTISIGIRSFNGLHALDFLIGRFASKGIIGPITITRFATKTLLLITPSLSVAVILKSERFAPVRPHTFIFTLSELGKSNVVVVDGDVPVTLSELGAGITDDGIMLVPETTTLLILPSSRFIFLSLSVI